MPMTRNSQPEDRHVASPNRRRDERRELQHDVDERTLSRRQTWPKQTRFAMRMLRQGGEALLRSREALGPVGFGHLMMGTWATLGAIATLLNLGASEFLERQVQTLFFQIRGGVNPPENLVILAIDEPSLEQDQFYAADPEQFQYLQPLSQWPWQRTAYAIAIERLMAAGAEAIAIDLIFDSPSSWGDSDDEQLLEAIQTYPDRITLAASYEDQILSEGQGSITQLIEPAPIYRVDEVHLGFINYWIDLDRRIHRLSQAFPELLAAQYPDQADYFRTLQEEVPSFDEAVLHSAEVEFSASQEDLIHFYGPARTFPRFSFWTVIDPETWEQHLRDEDFKDKIVLIGPTATLFQDIHPTPFGPMSGVEVHANAIATLMTGRAIAELLPNRYLQGLLVFAVTLGSGLLISQPERLTQRGLRTLAVLIVWGAIGYGVFVGTHRTYPIAVPAAVIAFGGASYILSGMVREKLHKLKLRNTLKHYASSPIIREIISQQDDLRDLLQEREQEALGKLLVGRYQLVEILGSGGFGETYIAADLQRPGHPLCVVKQLRPVTNDLKLLNLAKRLFQREAETLERLGRHDQIPQLLAYFEEGQEFYLVQEFIDGHPLRQELLPGQPLSESKTVEILYELLKILEFIHSCRVIHRDIKPSNIIRRRADQAIVLIDFGAVKEIQTQLADDQTQAQTIGIGTRGYMPSEQYAGNPRFNSDIYAVGVVCIQALTGLPPDRLPEDPKTGEFIWQDKASPSIELEAILTTMTRYSFGDRYQSVSEVFEDLSVLLNRYDLPKRVETAETVLRREQTIASILALQTPLNQWDEDDWQDNSSYDLDAPTLPWSDIVVQEEEETLPKDE